MKLNAWHFWGLVIIALWVLVSASQPGFGFVPMDGAEATGYNVGRLIFPVVGLLFIYKGWKKTSKTD